MSNDSDRHDKLTATYRDLARERTPEDLDQKVLRMAAARAPRSGYSQWTVRARPLAWAATIALCLAITLELWLPQEPAPGVASPADTAVSTEANAPDTNGRSVARQAAEAPKPNEPIRQAEAIYEIKAQENGECSDDARSAPETWLACIEELEAAGRADAAAEQRESLTATFPDFPLP